MLNSQRKKIRAAPSGCDGSWQHCHAQTKGEQLFAFGWWWWVLTGSNRRPTPCKGLFSSSQLLATIGKCLIFNDFSVPRCIGKHPAALPFALTVHLQKQRGPNGNRY
jgi:hypothetical protein